MQTESVPPLALSAGKAAKSLGISPRKLWELTNAGQIPYVRIGRRLLYPVAALAGWLEKKLATG